MVRSDLLAIVALCLGTASAGLFDDMAGSGERRGFKGHFRALAGGELSTGMVKMGVVALVCVAVCVSQGDAVCWLGDTCGARAGPGRVGQRGEPA